jgi:hypothetical protein
MDRLEKLRSELSSEKACAKNEALTPTTQKDCSENAQALRDMIDEVVSRALMESSMAGLNVSDKHTAPDANADAVTETPYMVPEELVWARPYFSNLGF